MIEKHVTDDRSRNGPDHPFAMTIAELATMVRGIRAMEAALGDGKKRVMPSEKQTVIIQRRGMYAVKDIAKGETIRRGAIRLFAAGGRFAAAADRAKSSAPRRGAPSRPGDRFGITMSSASRVVAVIPAFNEAKTIAAVVTDLRAHVADVIVVDDHSADATGEEAKRAGAIVVRNAANLGYDGSLNAGFAEAACRGAGIILTFDADGEHDAGGCAAAHRADCARSRRYRRRPAAAHGRLRGKAIRPLHAAGATASPIRCAGSRLIAAAFTMPSASSIPSNPSAPN